MCCLGAAHLLVVSSEEKVRISPSVHCGLGIGGRLGSLESGGATGLTIGR